MTPSAAKSLLVKEDIATKNMQSLLEVFDRFDVRPDLEETEIPHGVGFSFRFVGERGFSGELCCSAGMVRVDLHLVAKPSPCEWSRSQIVRSDRERRAIAGDLRRMLKFMGFPVRRDAA